MAATDDDDDDDDVHAGRNAMRCSKAGQKPRQPPPLTKKPTDKFAMHQQHFDQVSSKDITSTIDNVINYHERERQKREREELEQRHMVRSNHTLTLRIILHEGE